MAKGPVKKFKSGFIEAAIWKSIYQDKDTYSVSLNRRYKKKSGEWENTNFLNKTDLLTAAFLLTEAYRWLNDNVKNEGGSPNDNDDDGGI